MNDATKRAASEALAQTLAVTAMLVIASILFYGNGETRRANAEGNVTVGSATTYVDVQKASFAK